jgi:hypothetical protein
MKTNPNEPLNCNNGNGFWREVNNVHFGSGLTKREYFAVLAMQGLLTTAPLEILGIEIGVAALAVKQADALINALNRSKHEKDNNNL